MKGAQPPITDAELNAYVDGEANPERRGEIEAYLVAEPAQAARIETWRRQNEIIRAAFAKVASEPLPLAHMLTLSPLPAAARPEAAPRAAAPQPVEEAAAEAAPASRSHSGRNSRLAGVTVAAFAAGALATMVVAEFSGMATSMLGERPDARSLPLVTASAPFDAGRLLAARAIEAYHTYAPDMVRPVEIDASHQAFLTKWLTRRVGFTIQVPDLTGAGLKLIGGRLTPGNLGPAAFLLYEASGGDRIGLFISRAATHEPQRLRYTTGHSGSAVYWLEDGAGYVLAGPAGPDRLMRIASFLLGQDEPRTSP